MVIENVEKLVASLHEKTENGIHIRNLIHALNHGLVLKKSHRVLKLNQNAQLKPYINMNTNLRKASANGFEKDFFNLMNNSGYWKIYGKY